MALTASEIKERVDIVQIIQGYGIKLDKNGREYKCFCPFHEDTDPSMSVSKEDQQYYCFGCGEGGDAIKFVQKHQNVDFKEALNILTQKSGIFAKVETNKEGEKEYKAEVWNPVSNIPAGADKYLPKKLYDRKITDYYPYTDKNGKIIGYTCRIPKVDGKDVFPLSWRSNGRKEMWRFKSFGYHIYGLHLIYKFPGAVIIVVEGEKNRDDLQQLIGFTGKYVVISCGNNSTVHRMNLKPLAGRTVILWPDADTHRYQTGHRKGEVMDLEDQPGISCMIKISKMVSARYGIVKPAKDRVNGWDVSDAIRGLKWGKDKVQEYMMSNIVPIGKLHHTSESKKVKINTLPFRALGFSSSRGNTLYHYLPNGTNSVFTMTAASHSKQNLIALAPIDFWEKNYPMKTGANYTAAANDMLRDCEAMGPFDPLTVRGRGAWYDDKRVILHLGDHLVIDNKRYRPFEVESKFIYETGIPLRRVYNPKPLSKNEGVALYDICKLMSWQNKISASFLSGWLFLAVLCGALRWRPHIWITGEGGTGKSWIMDNIISKILGKFCINLTGSSTTEAGVRGMIGTDAMPVRWDESDSNDRDTYNALVKIIELARSSSSNDESVVAKGTATGGYTAWRIRSTFMFSSVVAKLERQSDTDRFTLLKLKRTQNYGTGQKFKQIKSMVTQYLTDEYTAKLRSRAVKMLPSILKNIEIFTDELSTKLNNRRRGDQIGTLLAGCYNLTRDGIANKDQIKEYINSIDWNNEVDTEDETDQARLLDTIFETIVQDLNRTNTTIGQLAKIAVMPLDRYDPEKRAQQEHDIKDAKAILGLYGIGVHKGGNAEICGDLAFSCKHKYLSSILDGTPWNVGYATVLERVTGAYKRYVKILSQRKNCIIIPTNQLFPTLAEDLDEEKILEDEW